MVILLTGLTVLAENDTLRNFVQQAEMINPLEIKVITKLPNSEQSYKGKVQTHNYINRQNQQCKRFGASSTKSISEPLNRNESGRFGTLKSDSTHHFFRNACTIFVYSV
jgi:hypothetical protein